METRQKRWLLEALVLVGTTCLLLSHKSDAPSLFGRYSPVYLTGSAGLIALVGVMFALYNAHGRKLLLACSAIMVAVVTGVLFIELIGQVYGTLHPAYMVMYLEPDRVLGWKHVPDFDFTWAGYGWYAADFSVPVHFGPAGHRDDGLHPVSRTAGKTRIALLGDSFVEAIQVPEAQTGARQLEDMLNAGKTSSPYEVFNFGTSSYGVGQCLLAWQQDTSRYAPDDVFILVSGLQMGRTVRAVEASDWTALSLRIRPTFKLTDGRLELEPAADYEAFVQAQNQRIADFGGQRMKRSPRETFWLQHFLRPQELVDAVPRLLKTLHPAPKVAAATVDDVDDNTLAVNLKILEELGKEVRAHAGRLVVVDYSEYFKIGSRLGPILKARCKEDGIGYICLSDRLIQANIAGTSTVWRHDWHFNVAGNRLFAESIYDYLTKTEGR